MNKKPEGKKVCSGCKISKHYPEYNRDKSRRDGCQRLCKRCLSAYNVEYQSKDRYKQAHRFYSNRYIKENPEKQRARLLAQRNVDLKDRCEECGRSDIPLHRHHEDYSKPLEVLTLCTSCHENKHHYV